MQMWILCESQENEFCHIVGRHDELHPASNTFLGLKYLQWVKNAAYESWKDCSLNFLEQNWSSHSDCGTCPWHFCTSNFFNPLIFFSMMLSSFQTSNTYHQ